MLPCPLRKQKNADDHDYRDCCGSPNIVDAKSAVRDRFVEGISNGGAEGARQNKGGPEEQSARQLGEEIECCDNKKRPGNRERATTVSEAVPRVWENIIAAQ
jgi:hypothetical protein